jgi:protein-S-isoprenylcysteine O-methyltransferase Ste14
MTSVTLRASQRLDIGRVVFLPLCALLVIVNALRVASGHTVVGHSVARDVAMTASTVLTLAFYWLVVRAYLRRLPARATSTALAVNAAALTATALPLVVPLVRPETPATAPVVLGDGLLLAGLVWSVWAVRTLGRSFSVIPQARAVVSAGPYRVVRHPLYLGEIVATLGLAVVRPSAGTFAAWLLLCVLQAFRATHEERLLAATLTDYDGYRRCTRRLVPGLY